MSDRERESKGDEEWRESKQDGELRGWDYTTQ